MKVTYDPAVDIVRILFRDATRSQKSIDALLLFFTILVIGFVFLAAKQKRSTSGASESVRASQPQHQLVAK